MTIIVSRKKGNQSKAVQAHDISSIDTFCHKLVEHIRDRAQRMQQGTNCKAGRTTASSYALLLWYAVPDTEQGKDDIQNCKDNLTHSRQEQRTNESISRMEVEEKDLIVFNDCKSNLTHSA